MNIGIVDADLIYRDKHRFPNLACMKISAYHKSLGDRVELRNNYYKLERFDKVYISKVFTDTIVPDKALSLPNVEIGGTGFYYDKAPALPDEIEHIMPDYDLYNQWVSSFLKNGGSRKDVIYFIDYSIGFLTRGCFRQCEFCVNQNYTKCVKHSSVFEFMDPKRPKLCFLDDNFFACSDWKNIIEEVKSTGKRFQFKQGLDERLLTDEKIQEMITWKYDNDFIFAFDNIEDREIIEPKLKRFRELYPNPRKHIKFYVLCGYDRNNIYDDDFFIKDICDTFERIFILSKYRAIPYIMRYQEAYKSKFSKVYSLIASWCNQPHMFTKFSFREFCMNKGMRDKCSVYKKDFDSYLNDGNKKYYQWRFVEEFSEEYPQISDKYFDVMISELQEY